MKNYRENADGTVVRMAESVAARRAKTRQTRLEYVAAGKSLRSMGIKAVKSYRAFRRMFGAAWEYR